MDYHSGYVVTLANSIIGVSVLAMPYCFRQSGIILAILMILFSNLLTRVCCHFLIKSAIITRRKTFENLAYHIFGVYAKLALEIGLIGFLIGTCIAFFVVMGDLGPELVSELTGRNASNTMRTSILMALALFFILPLGLLRDVTSLNGVSKVTIGFYFCLVLKVFVKALPQLFHNNWTTKVNLWRPAGIIQCLPIFSMALSCQTQLFEIYQIVNNPSLDKMNEVVRNAINMCTLVYCCVGFFGYIGFAHKNFTGNILLSFTPSALTNAFKLGFILSVAVSFPLVIFPCRASMHSLIYKEGLTLQHEGANTNYYIPEGRFKAITLCIIFLSLLVGILIPNIELVLGLVGSTIGIVVCILFPVLSFIQASQKNTNERLLAKIIFTIGFLMMILGTYDNLNRLEKIDSAPIVENFASEKIELIKINDPRNLHSSVLKHVENRTKVTGNSDIRHEPPAPIELQEPEQENIVKVKNDELEQQKTEKVIPETEKYLNIKTSNKTQHAKKSNSQMKTNKNPVNITIKTNKKTNQKHEEIQKKNHLEEHKILFETIKKQNKVQEEIVKQQRKLIEVFEEQQKQKVNEEKLKAVKRIESIALKAIEKLSGDVKENEKIVADLKNDVGVKEKKINTNQSSIIKLNDDKKVGNNSNRKKIKPILPIRIDTIHTKPSLSNIASVSINNKTKHTNSEDNDIKKKNLTVPLLLNLGKKYDSKNISEIHPSNTQPSKIKSQPDDKSNNEHEESKNENKVIGRDTLSVHNYAE